MLNDKRVDVKKALSRDSTGRVLGSKPPRDNAGGNRGGWGGWSGELISYIHHMIRKFYFTSMIS